MSVKYKWVIETGCGSCDFDGEWEFEETPTEEELEEQLKEEFYNCGISGYFELIEEGD